MNKKVPVHLQRTQVVKLMRKTSESIQYIQNQLLSFSFKFEFHHEYNHCVQVYKEPRTESSIQVSPYIKSVEVFQCCLIEQCMSRTYY